MEEQKADSVHLGLRSSGHRLVQELHGAKAAALLLAALGAMGRGPTRSERKQRTRVPMMVCSPSEVIAAWNDSVAARSDRTSRIAKARADRNVQRAFKGNGQAPIFPKEREHTQHKHPLRDEHGAYTAIGLPHPLTGKRRMWLAGVSAQRGY